MLEYELKRGGPIELGIGRLVAPREKERPLRRREYTTRIRATLHNKREKQNMLRTEKRRMSIGERERVLDEAKYVGAIERADETREVLLVVVALECVAQVV